MPDRGIVTMLCVPCSGERAGHAGHRPAAGFGNRSHEVVRAAPVNDRATW
ncbi:hypothetical protein LHGZ1_0719 [Laribacter hongkongensis]|uniref:Uncharacterized protein n=1 Tax=Laribacter hongkongensis TaxID=168471 RepID=A0A248LFF7_9NEIS|nr:hypothetical protein LHGZ1_0719 [Laribacter hongkongensis]